MRFRYCNDIYHVTSVWCIINCAGCRRMSTTLNMYCSDLTDVSQNPLRRVISTVSQKYHLFAQTNATIHSRCNASDQYFTSAAAARDRILVPIQPGDGTASTSKFTCVGSSEKAILGKSGYLIAGRPILTKLQAPLSSAEWIAACERKPPVRIRIKFGNLELISRLACRKKAS